MPPSASPRRPPLTRAGLLLGIRLTLPFLPVLVAFAAAFGAVAALRGLSLAEAVAASMLVFAGAAQLVALEAWPRDWTPGAVLAVAALTLAVNARFILMGAALQPWLGPMPRGFTLLNLFVLTDMNWLLAMRYRAGGGEDAGVALGAGLTLWMAWWAATIPGHLAGNLVADPRRLGLDLVVPIFFAASLVPLWQGRRDAAPWAASAAVALVAAFLVPGYLFIAAGALAGAVVAGVRDDG